MSHTIAINHGTGAVQLDAYDSRRTAEGVTVAYAVEDLIEATRRALQAAGGDLADHYLARIGDPGAPMPASGVDRGPLVVQPGIVTNLAGIPGEDPVRVQVTHIEADGPGYRISAVPA